MDSLLMDLADHYLTFFLHAIALSISLTLDTYSHIIPTLQKQAAEKMEALLNA
jgi:hypothetical protein